MEINGKSPLVDLSSQLNRLDIKDQLNQRFQEPGQTSVSSGHDRIELSVRSRELQYLDKLIQSIPDVREALVEQVRRSIGNGTYNVRAEHIADKILGGDLIDEVF